MGASKSAFRSGAPRGQERCALYHNQGSQGSVTLDSLEDRDSEGGIVFYRPV